MRWLCLLLLVGCGKETVEAPSAVVQLARRPGGQLALELSGATNAQALQVELLVTSEATYELVLAASPPGVVLDTVRLQARGPNRAMVFVGDKRGLRLPADGEVARFELRGAGTGQIQVGRVVLADERGLAIPTTLGPALSLR